MRAETTVRDRTGKRKELREAFRSGLRHGVPVGLGYLVVSFTLGIAARKGGMTALQAALMSFSIHASAGEFAAIGIIAACAGYWEMAVTELVVNLRYLLMSASLSQKLPEDLRFFHRFSLAFCITDEIYALSVTRPGRLNPFFTYGMMAVASPGWVVGTFLGAAAGGILPAVVIGAMSIALYGMFLSVILPPARKDRVILATVAASMLLSGLCAVLPGVLTLLLSAAAALLFPRKEEEAEP